MPRKACRLPGRTGGVCAAALLLALVIPTWPASGAGGTDILTYHGDPARTGWNAAEETLTPEAVRSGKFGVQWTAPVEGDIYAQPLVVHGVVVGGTARTILYVVTEHDLVYALDAADGRPLWGPVSLGRPISLESLPCGNIDPVGITATPVIDRDSATLYVSAFVSPEGAQTKAYKIAALDLATGAMRPGWPVRIAPPATGGLRFDPGVQQQRGALALVRGVVYIPFGGFWGDCGYYHGWVVGVPVAHPAAQVAFVTPTHRMGGIWAAVAADSSGTLYASTGNSDSLQTPDLGESVVRLETSPRLRFSGAGRDFFTPSNFAALNATDTDLGSAAPLVLPPQPGSIPHLLFIAGKQGVGYLVNRDNMGGVARGNGITGEGVYSLCLFGNCQGGGPKVFSAAAYWDGGGAGRFILVPGHGSQPQPCRGTGGVVAVRLEAAASRAPALHVAWCSPSMSDAGAPTVSSAGPEGGLVWIVDTRPGILYALDARTGAEVYASPPEVLGGTHRFIAPVVADGRVYVGAAQAVVAFGLRKPASP
jgi:outer membrane protein assembly factor BamB